MNEIPEFDDEKCEGSYRLSAKARAEIARMAREHGLRFKHNPGGGEFIGPNGWRCQIHECDDVQDLHTLRDAIARKKP